MGKKCVEKMHMLGTDIFSRLNLNNFKPFGLKVWAKVHRKSHTFMVLTNILWMNLNKFGPFKRPPLTQKCLTQPDVQFHWTFHSESAVKAKHFFLAPRVKSQQSPHTWNPPRLQEGEGERQNQGHGCDPKEGLISLKRHKKNKIKLCTHEQMQTIVILSHEQTQMEHAGH